MNTNDFDGNPGPERRGEERAIDKGGLQKKWDKIDQRLRAELGEELFASWFARMEPEEVVGAKLVVSLPTRFLQNWVRTHYYDRLLKIVDAVYGDIDTITVKVRARGVPVRTTSQAQADAFDQPPSSNSTGSNGRDRVGSHLVFCVMAARRMTVAPLSTTTFTFETFISGPSNSLAYSAARRVSDTAPGLPVSFNPLYLHANAGLGKTHLLHAISWRIRQVHPSRKVLYLTAERFMYHFLGALKARDVLPFKDYFQSVDVLLIDDFQFLQGKSMQQEFCHTFNSLVDMKRQVIVAADLAAGAAGKH